METSTAVTGSMRDLAIVSAPPAVLSGGKTVLTASLLMNTMVYT